MNFVGIVFELGDKMLTLSSMAMQPLEPLFLIGSFSFLQVTRTTIKSWLSSNFRGIPPLTSELAALECLKNRTISLLAFSRLRFCLDLPHSCR